MGEINGSIVVFCVSFVLLGFVCPVFSADYNQEKSLGSVQAQNDFSEYMTELRSKIQKNWFPPECLERDGHALIKFSVSRNGEIYAQEIVESSGDVLFDESALEALRKSAPFAHFPAETSRGSLTIKYSFDTSVVNTGDMQKYVENSDRFFNVDNNLALDYINKAIGEVDGDISAYFLYGKRSEIKRALGDSAGADEDLDEAKRLKAKYDRKRIMSSKLLVEMEQTPYSYFNLAHSYDIAGDYKNAIDSIDRAIALTNLNNNYIRYRKELSEKASSDLDYISKFICEN